MVTTILFLKEVLLVIKKVTSVDMQKVVSETLSEMNKKLNPNNMPIIDVDDSSLYWQLGLSPMRHMVEAAMKENK